MSDHPSHDDSEGNPFGGFGIPIPRAIMDQMMASRQAHEERNSKLRVQFDSILQRFRINMHLLTEGIDGIDEQTYRQAFKAYQKAEDKVMGLNGFPPKVRKVITAALRELLDFVDYTPPCPHCDGDQTDGEHNHVQEGATVAETDEARREEIDAAYAVIDQIGMEEVLDARMIAAGIKYEFESPSNIIIYQPTDVDDIRSFPSFLAALKLDFPNFSFTTK